MLLECSACICVPVYVLVSIGVHLCAYRNHVSAWWVVRYCSQFTVIHCSPETSPLRVCYGDSKGFHSISWDYFYFTFNQRTIFFSLSPLVSRDQSVPHYTVLQVVSTFIGRFFCQFNIEYHTMCQQNKSNKQSKQTKQTKRTSKRTDKQTKKQTNKQTNKQPNKQTKLTNK